MSMLIRNATMILPETTVIGDLLIVDGIITAIQPGGGLQPHDSNTQIIDASGLHLLPGPILKYTSETLVSLKKRICTAALVRQPAGESPLSLICQTMFLVKQLLNQCITNWKPHRIDA